MTPLEIVLWSLASLAVLASITVAILLIISRRLRVAFTSDELYKIRTPDGWTLPIRRWKPATPSSHHPVILCHGLGATALEFDIAEHISLARYLRARGFDVWAVDLRGRDEVVPPVGSGAQGYAFDHHVDVDVPATIAFVKAETRAEKVAWVGHSMGGMVIYGHAEQTGAPDVACAVTLSSPSCATFTHRSKAVALAPFLSLIRWETIHAGFWSRLSAPLLGWVKAGPVWLLLNPTNAEGWVMRAGTASVLCDLSTRVVRQLDRWTREGTLLSEDGKRAYFTNLGRVTTPWLAFGGAGDRLVPWQAAKAGFDALGSTSKKWILAGRENGHAADYGHCDLVMGPRAALDVFAPIASFLEEHATARSPVGSTT